MSSSDWPWSRAEQRSGEGLSLKEGGVMTGTQREGGANGGGCCRDSCQVGRHYSGGQRRAQIFTNRHLHCLFAGSSLGFGVGTELGFGWFSCSSVFMASAADVLFELRF